MSNWTFVFEGEDEPVVLSGASKEEPIKDRANVPEPLKATRSQPTPFIPEVVPIKNEKATQWNFTGARLKPHVVGVHFDKHSQYMGNWKGDAPSKEKKQKKKSTSGGVQTRPLRQIKRSIRKASNRCSAPTRLKTNELRRSASQFTAKNVEINGNIPCTSGDSRYPLRDPQFQQITNPLRSAHRSQSGHYQNPVPYSPDSRFAPAALQRYPSDQSNLYAPEPLYRSSSLPQESPQNISRNNGYYPSEPQSNELLELLDFSFPESNQRNSGQPSSLHKTRDSFSFVETSDTNDFDGLDFSAAETRIQPTHVYFSEDTSFQAPSYENRPGGTGSSSTYQHGQEYQRRNSNTSFQSEPSYPPLQSHNSRNIETDYFQDLREDVFSRTTNNTRSVPYQQYPVEGQSYPYPPLRRQEAPHSKPENFPHFPNYPAHQNM